MSSILISNLCIARPSSLFLTLGGLAGIVIAGRIRRCCRFRRLRVAAVVLGQANCCVRSVSDCGEIALKQKNGRQDKAGEQKKPNDRTLHRSTSA